VDEYNKIKSKFQAEASVLSKIRKSKKTISAIHKYMNEYPGRPECIVCDSNLDESFCPSQAPISNIRGEGECRMCGIPYYKYHYIEISPDRFIKIEYYCSGWSKGMIPEMRNIWLDSDYDKKEFWRNVISAFPVT